MKLVVLEKDTYGYDIDYTVLTSLVDEVDFYDLTSPEEVAERVADADIILVNKVLMNEASLKDAKNLKLLLEGATGYNNVDIPYAKSRGIAVSNVAGYSVQIVPQHTFALYLALSEHLAYYDNYVKSGAYTKSQMFSCFNPTFQELEGKTWGIIGLGNIGKRAANIARAFGCRVIYYSTTGSHDDPDFERVSFDELLGQSDVISIHSPLNEKTHKLIDKEALKKMKASAYLINVGRGPIVDEQALADALNENEIAGAALDVMEIEPLPMGSPLLSVKDPLKLLLTPHMAWASKEARQRLINEVAKNLEDYQKGGQRNRVDL